MICEIVPALPSHCAALSWNLRDADRREVEAAGMTGQRALWRSYRLATYARTALLDGEVAAMWGVGGTPLSRVGRPWLLTAPIVEKAPVTFLRVGRQETALMLTIWPELKGFVDSRYHRALRLLEALGFALSEPVSYGPNGSPFCEYSLRRVDWVSISA